MNPLMKDPGQTDRPLTDRTQAQVQALLDPVDVRLNGTRPWDLRIHHPDTVNRILAQGSLGLGESYMDGWWDSDQIDELIARVLRGRIDRQVRGSGLWWSAMRAKVLNLQSRERAWQVGREHYDLGNDLFTQMLDPYMAYSCGYWADAHDLAQAQEAKLDMICRKLGLRAGMRLLDIGCGWGSLMRFAVAHYGVQAVGLTVSKEQAAWGQARTAGLPVQWVLSDYRAYNPDGQERFDRVASVGMFEHVGHRNYRDFFALARRCLHDEGLFLLHTIGKNRAGGVIDPWIERHIFPNGSLPSVSELSAEAERCFVIEDWHNFGADYDKTLMAWHARFEAAWPSLRERYTERFYRMWRYYLLSCAGTFRARDNQLWQVVLSPRGVPGGYRRPRQ